MTYVESTFDSSLQDLLEGEVYQAYSYSYPHKTSYRRFDEPVSLKSVWEKEKQDALFLYVHIPFCEMRCGFCNLFTLVRPDQDLPNRYLDALERQINTLKPLFTQSRFARFAIGGGTPTYFSVSQLSRLLDLTDRLPQWSNMPIGIETSPETISVEKIQLLEQRHVTRISMGVQSFTENETLTLARRQANHQVNHSIDIIRANSSADLNLDLIYGIAGQTVKSWLYSLQQAITFTPEELYLYPLYVREKTGLGKVKQQGYIATDLPDNQMLTLYQTGRNFLLANGYQQISMRMFRRQHVNTPDQPVYRCQEDGMLGLGAGARSYTQNIHYSSEYAVGRSGVKDIIQQYVDATESWFENAHYGVSLSVDEQKRRFIMQSLLIADGLNLTHYSQRFNSDCLDEFVQLSALVNTGLAVKSANQIMLTEQGVERADSIGPWFGSAAVKARMSEYQPR